VTGTLLLRRASISRPSGSWHDNDFNVFAGDEVVGRIYRLNAATEAWWWGVAFELTGRESYGYAASLDEAKVAFRAEYEGWQRERP
jgi:hypothetical protein